MNSYLSTIVWVGDETKGRTFHERKLPVNRQKGTRFTQSRRRGGVATGLGSLDWTGQDSALGRACGVLTTTTTAAEVQIIILLNVHRNALNMR